MKIVFYGGQIAGQIALLSLLAKKYDVVIVIPEDNGVKNIARTFGIKTLDKDELDNTNFLESLIHSVDLFVCCHGKKILSKKFVRALKCINIHPCLYKYKGKRPILRLINDKNPKASVASHFMTERVDQGKVIIEKFKIIKEIEGKSESEVYSQLYPLYSQVLVMTIEKISNAN